MKDVLLSVTRSRLSLFGAAITTAAAVLIVSLLFLTWFGFEGGPYLGIIAFGALPAIFVVGLLLIPIGLWLARRRYAEAAARGEAPTEFPVLDLNRPGTRQAVLVALALTIVNVVILAATTYEAVEFMESPKFCGAACHSVMQPEYTAWQHSPHARVACVDCHIGSGADWFVRSKLSGSWQVVSVNLKLYPKPIPTPIHNLRPARETCEQCHWPTKFVGDRLKTITHFDEDEGNSPKKTVLLVRVGGTQGARAHGIHWHVDPNVRVRYRSDETRERIDEIEVEHPDGRKTLYTRNGAAPAASGEWRHMDCVDCHNRPSHVYHPPEVALDRAIEAGLVDRSLPFVRREGMRLLKLEYASHEEANKAIKAQLAAFYQKEYPQIAQERAEDIRKSAQEIAELYAHNVFPSMKVGWNTYPNHIGHQQSPGCFRCHDDEHKSADGRTIGQDCTTCHSLLAVEESDPAILKQLIQ